MTKKQFAALQRILEREATAYRALPGRPVPGQHPSEDKFAVSDGNICILLDAPLPNLPMGERVDFLVRIVHNERKGETHFPVPENQIDRPHWMRLIKRGGSESHGVELAAPILHPDQLIFEDAGVAKTSTEVTGKFDPQLLIDAVEVTGGRKAGFFLGFGPFNGHFPSLLVMPPDWNEHNCTKPIALVLPLRI